MTEFERGWIDGASFEELYRKLRHEPINSPWFAGDTGLYFMTRFRAAKEAAGSREAVRISKKIGWRATK